MSPRYRPLSDREREVLDLMGQGYSVAEIAEALVMSRRTVDRLVARVKVYLGRTARPEDGGGAQLTRRQEEVLSLLRRGLTNRAIGEELRIAERTVDSHVAAVLRRLQVRTRRDLLDENSAGRGPDPLPARKPVQTDPLSPRQSAVLTELRAGRTDAEIGERLGIGVRTVETHVRQILKRLGKNSRREFAESSALGAIPVLSNRELQAWRLIAEGLSNSQIAVALGINIRTVESHAAAIARKLGVTRRLEVIRRYPTTSQK